MSGWRQPGIIGMDVADSSRQDQSSRLSIEAGSRKERRLSVEAAEKEDGTPLDRGSDRDEWQLMQPGNQAWLPFAASRRNVDGCQPKQLVTGGLSATGAGKTGVAVDSDCRLHQQDQC